MFSRRTAWDLGPNRIARALEEHRASGRALLDLTESNPTAAGLDYPGAAIRTAIAGEASLQYAPDPRGLPSARTILAERLAIEPERLILTASTSEAYGWLFKLLCDPGDEVLAPVPSYPLCEVLANLESVRVRTYPLRWDGSWHIDLPALEAAIGLSTRAILVVHPNNPTGVYLKEAELAALDELCVRHGLALVSDEVFLEYPRTDDLGAPGARRAGMVARDTRAPSFSMSGLSKQAGLPQLKLGWMVVGGEPGGRAATIDRLEMIADTYLSVATPVQVGLPALLSIGDTVRARIQARLVHNEAVVNRLAAEAPALDVLPAEGGWYAVLRVPQVRSDEEWVLHLLDGQELLVQPGYFFDFAGGGFLVVSLLTRPEVLEEGFKRIVAAISAGTV